MPQSTHFGGNNGNGEPFVIGNDFAGITFIEVFEAGTYTISITEHAHDIKQLDIKYLPIIKEDKELVLEINNFINDTSHYDASLGTLLGKYSITIDDKSYTLFFNAIEDFSVAENEIAYIETFNGSIYIAFLDGGTHSVKIEKIIEVIDDKYLPQPDWNQYDENAPDYIKNRTHYEITTPLSVVESNFGTAAGYTSYKVGPYDWKVNKPISLRIDSIVYEFDSYINDGYLGSIGRNIYRVGAPYAGGKITDSSEYPFSLIVFHSSLYDDEEYAHIEFADDSMDHTVEIYSGIKQLDEKYIPDTIMRTPTEDDALELVVELGLAEPMTDDEGNVLTDENGILFIL